MMKQSVRSTPTPILSPLVARLALRIIEMAGTGEIKAGSHLREHVLAERFQVSRSPIRDALRALKGLMIVEHHRYRGCFVATPSPARLALAAKRLGEDDEDAMYREIASLRLEGNLPAVFSQADLGRRFGLSRGGVARIVERMSKEGWIERRPGYGWAFVPVLTTANSLDMGYRFRRAIEPAALLEPSFKADLQLFRQIRDEQEAIAEGRWKASSSVELFQVGSRFHEVLAWCSGNMLFFDAVQRVNRLRRLLEYRAMVDMRPFLNQAREHVTILDLVEARKMKAASELMDQHLDRVLRVKMRILEHPRGTERSRTTFAAATVNLHF